MRAAVNRQPNVDRLTRLRKRLIDLSSRSRMLRLGGVEAGRLPMIIGVAAPCVAA
jgi:hypothetical protein